MLVWVSNKNRSRSNSSNSESAKSIGKPASDKPKTHSNSLAIEGKNTITNQRNSLANIVDAPTTKQHKQLKLNSNFGFSNKQVQSLQDIFDRFDEDEDNLLSLNQFQNLLEAGGQPITITTAKLLFKSVKGTKKNQIQFQDLLALLSPLRSQAANLTNIQQVFKSFDKKNRGAFDFEDYFVVSRTIKQQIDEAELREAFELMDEDRDGLVSLKQFRKAMVRL